MATDNQRSKKQQTDVFRREGRNWLVLLVLVIAALLISSAVALGARWIYREFIKDEPARTPVPTATDRLPAASETSGAENTQSPETGADSAENQNSTDDSLPVTGG